MRGLQRVLATCGLRTLAAEAYQGTRVAAAERVGWSSAGSAAAALRHATTAACVGSKTLGARTAHAAAVARQHFHHVTTRQYGFAAQAAVAGARRGALSAPAAALRPAGMAGSSLARHAPARAKSTLAMGGRAAAEVHAAGAAEAFGPAALTVGLTSGQRRALAWWLGSCSAWVFALVVLGGITRLTRSGLSMTEWKFTGERPPSTQEEWEGEFEKYKLSPEYLKVNMGMTLDEFKFIYWMEYGHRMWGRALGLVFALPAAAFAARGMINAPLARRLTLLFLMGGTQGLVGWWMVRSGLQEREDNKVPRVSPYRLAAHLTSAFAIYATLVWTTLSVALPYPPALAGGPEAARAAKAVSRAVRPVAALVAITAVSGAFVAGLDAGHAYNTFPDMNGEWVPSDYWAVPGWRNAFENTAAVQLHHRLLALSTLAAVGGLWRYGTQLQALPRAPRLLLHALLGGVCGQVALGVTTLLTYVPVSLGSAHQAGALTLFTLMLGLLYSVRPAPGLSPLRLALAKVTTPAAAAAVLGIGGTVVQMH